MTFQEFYRALPPSKRAVFCKKIRLNQRYVELHLLNVQRRNPRDKTMEAMALHSEGVLTYQDVVASFPKIDNSTMPATDANKNVCGASA